MAKILEMPKLSPTMEEGVLSAWHKKEGDAVAVDDLLAEVETDKATMEFRAFDKGTLLKLLVEAGAQVKLGQPVAILGQPGEDVSALLPKAERQTGEGNRGDQAQRSEPKAQPSEETQPTASTPREAGSAERSAAPVAPSPGEAPKAPARGSPRSNLDRTEHERANGDSPTKRDGRVLASPYVRKAAREMGVDLAGAQGSGPGGRIVAKDLDALKQRGPAAIAPTPPAARQPSASAVLATTALGSPEVRPLSMMRKTIARRLTESKQNVPHFYLTVDVDADELVALRERINAELAASAPPVTPPRAPPTSASAENGSPERKRESDRAPSPLKVSLTDLLVKACAAALLRVPECNAQFTPDAILIHHRIDISVAVAVPDGLLTPVVRNADGKSVVAIAREVRELAARARTKKLMPEEMTNGTFSISNLGMFGIDAFSAVINPPEGAILAVGQVREVPVVRGGALAIGKKLAMTLSCDHRVVDGAVGAAFLAELRALLEHPMRVLTG